MKNQTPNQKNTPREGQPTKPLKKQADVIDSNEKRKNRESWSEVAGKEEERKKQDDSKVKDK